VSGLLVVLAMYVAFVGDLHVAEIEFAQWTRLQAG
jgi:hypothetical protein